MFSLKIEKCCCHRITSNSTNIITEKKNINRLLVGKYDSVTIAVLSFFQYCAFTSLAPFEAKVKQKYSVDVISL